MSVRDDIMKRRQGGGSSFASDGGVPDGMTLTEAQVARRERQSEPDTPLPKKSYTRKRKAVAVMEPGSGGAQATVGGVGAAEVPQPTGPQATGGGTAAVPQYTQQREATAAETVQPSGTQATGGGTAAVPQSAQREAAVQGGGNAGGERRKVGSYAELVERLSAHRPRTAEEIEKEKRRKRSEALLAAFGDGAVALTNLIGSTKEAPAIKGSPQLSARQQAKWDEIRKKREADRDTYYTQLMRAMQLDDAGRRADEAAAERARQNELAAWYKQKQSEYNDKRLQQQADHQQALLERDNKRMEEQARHNKKMEELSAQRNIISASKGRGGGGGSRHGGGGGGGGSSSTRGTGKGEHRLATRFGYLNRKTAASQQEIDQMFDWALENGYIPRNKTKRYKDEDGKVREYSTTIEYKSDSDRRNAVMRAIQRNYYVARRMMDVYGWGWTKAEQGGGGGNTSSSAAKPSAKPSASGKSGKGSSKQQTGLGALKGRSI